MPMGRPKVNLVLSEDGPQLTSMVRWRSIPAALVARARIVLAAAAGESNSEIAKPLQQSRATVGKFRTRFLERRINAPVHEFPPSVHRYFKLLVLQPHRSETFKLATDAFFIEKLCDVVGLHLNPP